MIEQRHTYQRISKQHITVLLGAMCLLLPAWYNGYPLLNPDDNTYLCSGFLPETPFDRPITYGLILWLTSMGGYSLMVAAALQCWVVSWLLVRIVQRTTNQSNYELPALACILLLSTLSSLSWVSSELLPDVYTGVAAIALLLILQQQERRTTNIALYLLYTVAIATHMSHVMIFSVVLAAVFLWRKILFDTEHRKYAVIRTLTALLLTIASVATMGSAISKSRHVFAIAALLDQGILKKYLDVQCPVQPYKLCAYKDKLPTDANEFLWSPNSVLYATGGWSGNKQEYNDILSGTMKSPAFIAMRARASVASTIRQAAAFTVGDGNFSIGDPLYSTVKLYIPRDTTTYRASRQYNSTLLPVLRIPNISLQFVVIVSLVLIAIVLARRATSKQYRLLAFAVITTVAVNIWVCATFGQVNGRYGCRVMWLMPFLALLGVIQLWRPAPSHTSTR